ncbi:MAG: Uncharacterized protein FD161_3454 [Limisphaerales bacterium]|nr:MAG: Uncharacterized protein FD161_3454 [Limisphaerales bacterium]KAG0507775.1 MAG: Uncharacterized protein E1N63_3120 [Limisphaerales bacterium]TXT51060.1 MAG: Uncharacterized protein FD140_1906 [Limisphaerales bacterium]
MRCLTHLLLLGLLAITPLLSGCSGLHPFAKVVPPGPRAFDFATDTLAVRAAEPAGMQTQEALASLALRGHVDAAVARQFFLHAGFDPAQPPPSNERRIALVREVLGRKADAASSAERRVVIPGYANLNEFSRLQGHLLRAESWLVCPCQGRAPMVMKALGGSGAQKNAAASELAGSLGANRPVLVRLYRHHALKYDRSLLLFRAEEQDGEVRFAGYDPAAPKQPVQLSFNRASRAFALSDDAAASGPALAVEIHAR